MTADPRTETPSGERADSSTAPTGVEVRGLYKSFGEAPVLRGVDLEVAEGSVTAILGPSGSGKTTLLRLIAGFARPDAGTIHIGGRLVDGPGRHVGSELRHIGYVPQEGSLFPHLDVRHNVGFGLPRAGRRARVAELLEMTGISELARRYPHQLSGGQQQRVALARALAPSPSLVLLDEPFSSLDAFLRTSVRVDVTDILARAGTTTTILVTHDQDEALTMADQVAVLRDGMVAQVGPPEDLYRRPIDAALARFVGEANLLAGTIQAGKAETPFGALSLDDGAARLPDGARVVVLVRPEQLAVTSPDQPASLPGLVGHCDYHGHDTVVMVDTAAGPITLRSVGAPTPSPGDRIGLQASGPVMAWLAPESRPA